MYVTNVAHTVRTFQNITPLTLCFEIYETNYWLKTTGVHATVSIVETVNELLVSAPTPP